MNKFKLTADDVVLVLVDIQERLAAVMNQRQKVVDNCRRLIALCRMKNLPVILNEQYPRGLGPTISEIKEALETYDPLEKMTFSCCGGDRFSSRLAAVNRREIILCGMETHVCVLQTCLDLLEEGYAVHAVSDAVCSRTKDNSDTALELMRDAGAVITCTETVLFQLLERAGTDDFKAISKLVK